MCAVVQSSSLWTELEITSSRLEFDVSSQPWRTLASSPLPPFFKPTFLLWPRSFCFISLAPVGRSPETDGFHLRCVEKLPRILHCLMVLRAFFVTKLKLSMALQLPSPAMFPMFHAWEHRDYWPVLRSLAKLFLTVVVCKLIRSRLCLRSSNLIG
jgi:hypothetical protein